ncbi:branched-chain amino acid ABC transporter permease [Candidatus Symbiobacter mobilis]|uniref:Branched-chain amino acid transporter permease protein n=1 Tax=Candidatus Symbiobacter mobilis CR TaxID=946483 RepID=U5N4I1_9BURK|nr:branched-chain amino acid transporter permease [Candidatus Symbiobacter mobilis]AGX86242.1 branched-chain amino acid transporter permease protein [Candidatus Symbiobacter mobilis CR]
MPACFPRWNSRWIWLLGLLALPWVLHELGNAWIRVANMALLYTMLAVGLNIVAGFAGLLDLGYIAFFAIGAYTQALLASPHLPQSLVGLATLFPDGLHTPWWVVLPLSFVLAGGMGVLLGAPTLRLRGDYLAIVTLGFGEIVRIFLNNLDHPVNLTNGPRGIANIDNLSILGHDLGQPLHILGLTVPPLTQYFYLLGIVVLLCLVLSRRLLASRIGRAWVAIREDELAAQSVGIDTRALKLLAFAVGASLGGVSGALFAALQGFVSPESFTLMESVMIVAMVVFGGIGHLPGVVLGAVVLSALPEALRHLAGPLQQMTNGHLDASILRQLLVSLAMVLVMLLRPHGLWPTPSSRAIALEER